jgi:hypothetical protein
MIFEIKNAWMIRSDASDTLLQRSPAMDRKIRDPPFYNTSSSVMIHSSPISSPSHTHQEPDEECWVESSIDFEQEVSFPITHL